MARDYDRPVAARHSTRLPPHAHRLLVGRVDPDHERQLTRDEVTAAVHYIGFTLSPDQVEAVAAGPVRVAVDHANDQHERELSAESQAELVNDLRDGT